MYASRHIPEKLPKHIKVDPKRGMFLPYFDIWKSKAPKGYPEPQERVGWWPQTQGQEWVYSFAHKYSGIDNPADCYAIMSFQFVDDSFDKAWYPNNENCRAELNVKFFNPEHSIDEPVFTQLIEVKLSRRFTEEYWEENRHRFFAEGGGIPGFNPQTYPISRAYVCPDCGEGKNILYIHQSLIGKAFKCSRCCYPQVPRKREEITEYLEADKTALEHQELQLQAIADEREGRRRSEAVYKMILDYKLRKANVTTDLDNFDKGSTIIRASSILDLSAEDLPAILKQAVSGALSNEGLSRLATIETKIDELTLPPIFEYAS